MKLIKRVSFLTVLAIMVLFIPLDSTAQFYNGNKLVEFMREHDRFDRGDQNASLLSAARFSGYVIGVYDATEGIVFATQSNVTVGQINAVVGKYLKENPEKWNQPAHLLVIEALQKAFPKK